MSTPKKSNEARAKNASFADPSERTPLKSGPSKLCGVTLQAAVVRIVTCIVSLAEGYDGAIFGAVATRLVKEFHLTPSMLGMLASIMPMACFLGAPLAGFLMSYMGRKTLLFLLCIVISSGALVQALAPTVFILGIGRFIIGIGTGAGLTTVTVYVAEVSPAQVRGLLTSLEEIFINLGMSLAFLVSWMLLGPQGVDWRDAMLIGVLLPLCAASMIPWSFTPESPRYHLLCGRVEEARTSMEKLGISDEEAEQTIQAWISSGNAESPRTLQDLRVHLKPLALAIVFSASTQLTGIVALHNLMPWVLASRLPEEEALRCATLISALKFAILIPVCFWLLDQVGRRPLLCASSFMFATSSIFTAAAFMNGSSGEVVAIGYGCILCSFSAGIGPATWPYIAELLPTPIRAYGTGIALMFGRVISMLWMFFFPVLFARKPELPLWMIAVFSTAAFIFYVAMCPETTQKTLENIQQSWEKQVVIA